MPATNHEKTGLILFAHGSSVAEANQAFFTLARTVSERSGHPFVQPAFLELAQPDLASAVRAAAEAGMERVVVVPCFLALGLHLRRDLPKLVEAAHAASPRVEIAIAEPFDGHPLLAELVLARAQEALQAQRL